MGAVAAPPARPTGPEELRRLLEARQRHLRARIAACEQLSAEMSALRAALQPPRGDTGPGPASPAPGGGEDAEPCGAPGAAGADGGGAGAEPEAFPQVWAR